MTKISHSRTVEKMVNDHGITRQALLTLHYGGTDVKSWLSGFDSVDESVLRSVDVLRNHPLAPVNVPVHGLIICPFTGKLELLANGYNELPVLTGGVPYGHTQWLEDLAGSAHAPAAADAAAVAPPRAAAASPRAAVDSERHDALEDNIAQAARRARSATHGGDSLGGGEGEGEDCFEAELPAAAAAAAAGGSARKATGGGGAGAPSAAEAVAQSLAAKLPASHTMSVGRAEGGRSRPSLRDVFNGKMGIN